jgi:DNA-binding transcriptional MerR regulator
MNGKEAAKDAGITEHKLWYWVSLRVISPSKIGKSGRAHEFTQKDIVWLKIAVMMRRQGYRLNKIRDLIKELQSVMEPK